MVVRGSCCPVGPTLQAKRAAWPVLLHRLLALLLLLLLQPLLFLLLLMVLQQPLLLGVAVPAASLLHTLRALEATVPACTTAE